MARIARVVAVGYPHQANYGDTQLNSHRTDK